jgi:hypothetical protein
MSFLKSKNVIYVSVLVAVTLILGFLPAFAGGGGNNSDMATGNNPHYLSKKEQSAWRILCAKINDEIDALHRRINVLKDAQNHRAKPEEIKAMAAAIRSSIDEVFNEVNSEMADRKLFLDDSKAFIGKLDSVRRSLENLGV